MKEGPTIWSAYANVFPSIPFANQSKDGCPEPRSMLIRHAIYTASSFWVISGSRFLLF